MSRIVLASASPRRRALLRDLGVVFDVIVSDADESFEGESAAMVVGNARAKCDDVIRRLGEPAVVVAADTLVFLGDRPLGKPRNPAEARDMLADLSGVTHQVITGVCVTDTQSGRTIDGSEMTDVTFRELTSEEIARFVEIVNPIDRAGAYTVDGPGSLLVARYDGCYQNVLGLPIVRLDHLLRAIGHSLFEWMEPDRCRFL